MAVDDDPIPVTFMRKRERDEAKYRRWLLAMPTSGPEYPDEHDGLACENQ